MERLETRKINGHTYYYYSKWSWVDGKCRRVWQKYLGKLEDWAPSIGTAPRALYAEVFGFGLPAALWLELQRQQIVQAVDELCPKRAQGLSIGEYLAIAAVNRAADPVSKNAMWDWFNSSALRRLLPAADRAALSSQRFRDHMDSIEQTRIPDIWKRLLGDCLRREAIEPQQVCHDGTNFYTFSGTFNSHCEIARRGKNKQGRSNLRQVSYAVFCSKEEQIPLYFDVYPGNRNDVPEFASMVERFSDFLGTLRHSDSPSGKPNVTLVFDKGNNSATNIALLDRQGLDFVGSVKPDEHKEVAAISNKDNRFTACRGDELTQVKAFREEKHVYGRSRTMVVCFNQRLFTQQWLTLNNDITKALEKLEELRRRLDDRAKGLIKGGKAPSVAALEKKVAAILSRQFLKSIVTVVINPTGPTLSFEVDTRRVEEVADTYLGKNLLITTRSEWSNEEIIQAYHGQYVVEHLFRQMKDRSHGSWWPLHHWTTQKIWVHGLYCTIAALLHALLRRRTRQAGLQVCHKRLIEELQGIQEVVNVFKRPGRGKTNQSQTVLTKCSEVQQRLVEILNLKEALTDCAPVQGKESNRVSPW
jgi:transposase